MSFITSISLKELSVPRLFSFLSFLFLVTASSAQPTLQYYLPAGTEYDPSIPTPESFFGFQVGEWHLTPEQIHAYMKRLDEVSPRFSGVVFGRSYESREMMLMTVTSPENQRNLENLRARHLSLSDPSASGSLNIASMPVVVWLGYSVHGNEPSGSNASVIVAYHLAAAQGEAIEGLLRECIILLNPSINPDGLHRFATWANMHKGHQPVGDPASREHNEAWPGGRGNHYWFDLNRDWMPVQHPETQGRIEQYYRWRPNVLTDHHEMGTASTFFFQPGVASRENPLNPPETRSLTTAIARYHERALNAIGSLYYSEEGFDDFYIGKGSSYPDITGGIGILFEQASSRGHLQESPNGPLSFPFTIRNQVTVSLSTLEAAREMRTELLEHQRTFFARAARLAANAPVKGYVFGTPHDKARTRHLVEILLRHRILVHPLAQSVRAEGREFEPGSAFVVPTAQPQYRLITSLFERRTTFTDSLFYDVSAWTLPAAFAIPWAELQSLNRGILGPPLATTPLLAGSLSDSRNAYAYVMEWNEYHAPRALYRFLKAGLIAKVATKPFQSRTMSGLRSFEAGTILLPVSLQSEKTDTLRALIDKAVREDGVSVHALETGLTPSGIDLGSSDFLPLKVPVVGLIVGSGAVSTDLGEAWHLLDQRMHMEASLLEAQALGRVRLDRYSTLVLSGGAGIDSTGKQALRQWVQRGGVLLAVEQGVQWCIENKMTNAKFRTEPARKDSIPPPREYALLEQHTRALAFPGTIFRTTYDRTHPLMFGYADAPLFVLKTTSQILEPSTNPYATPMRYAENPLAAGYMHRTHATKIAGSGGVVVQALQSGRVILFADNPNFRAFWFGTNRMFLNAVFFGPVISSASARPPEEAG